MSITTSTPSKSTTVTVQSTALAVDVAVVTEIAAPAIKVPGHA